MLLLAILLVVHARFEGNKSSSQFPKCGIDSACLGKELMKAEGQQCVALAGIHQLAVNLANP